MVKPDAPAGPSEDVDPVAGVGRPATVRALSTGMAAGASVNLGLNPGVNLAAKADTHGGTTTAVGVRDASAAKIAPAPTAVPLAKVGSPVTSLPSTPALGAGVGLVSSIGLTAGIRH